MELPPLVLLTVYLHALRSNLQNSRFTDSRGKQTHTDGPPPFKEKTDPSGSSRRAVVVWVMTVIGV